jgi:hypothetical protein
MKWVYLIPLAILIGLTLYPLILNVTEIDVSNDNDPVYMIMDATVRFDENAIPTFDITLPNGKVISKHSHLREVPDEISEVIIKATNIGDISTYKIVGLR